MRIQRHFTTQAKQSSETIGPEGWKLIVMASRHNVLLWDVDDDYLLDEQIRKNEADVAIIDLLRALTAERIQPTPGQYLSEY